jgi:multisubunit Na+/H+ antiporter MnhF subunit
MNGWLLCAVVLAATLVPLTVAAALRPPRDGLVALIAAGPVVSIALLLTATGMRQQSLADVALVCAASSFVGALAFLRFLAGRVR